MLSWLHMVPINIGESKKNKLINENIDEKNSVVKTLKTTNFLAPANKI